MFRFSLGDETFENFRLLGFLLKKMTCLLPTVKKIRMFTQLMSKIDPCSARADRLMMSLRGVALHKLVEGWKEEEVIYAAELVLHTLLSDQAGSLTSIMAPDYMLGSLPDFEIHVSNFLLNIFVNEVKFEQLTLWIDTLVTAAGVMLPRLLLVLTAPVQWEDHVTEHPVSQFEAYHRYHVLALIIQTVRKGKHSSLVPQILSAMFNIPSPWLTDNIGSVLCLLDRTTCLMYLNYQLHNVRIEEMSTGIIGLVIMALKFGQQSQPVLDRMDEVIMMVPGGQREEVVRAIWKALTEEVTNIRPVAGEVWASERRIYLCKVIRLIGQRMTERAFLEESDEF